MNNREDITYDRFGIDPVEYYSTKFADVGAVWDFARSPSYAKRSISWQKFDFLLEAIRSRPGHGEPGYRILDIGSGSGRFGAFVKEALPNVQVVGIDMSEHCVETCLANGYNDAYSHNFIEGLPFDDNAFDFVFSCDVFGHIEFKDKDRVLAEIARVTKPLGAGWHGIEAAAIDYFSGSPADPDDPIRRYVHIDGHIGVESLDQCYDRFSRFMNVTQAFNWLVRPLLETVNALNYDQWGAEFSRDVLPLRTQEATDLSDAILGMLNRQQLNSLFSAFGPILTQRHLTSVLPEGPVREYVLSLTNWGGCAMLSTGHPKLG